MAVMGDNVFEQYATNDQDRQISRALSQMFDAAQSNQDYNRVNQHANYLYAQEQLPPWMAQEAQRYIKETPGATNQAMAYGNAYHDYLNSAGSYYNDPAHMTTFMPESQNLQQAILNTVQLPGGYSGIGDVRSQQREQQRQSNLQRMADRGTQAAMGMPGFGMGEVNGQQVLYPEAGAKNAALRSESLARASVDPVTGVPRQIPGDGSGGLMADAVQQMFTQDFNNQTQRAAAKAEQTAAEIARKQAEEQAQRDHETMLKRMELAGKSPGSKAPLINEFESEVQRVRKMQQSYDTAAAMYPEIVGLARNPDTAQVEMMIGGRKMTPTQWVEDFRRSQRPADPVYEKFIDAYEKVGHPAVKLYRQNQPKGGASTSGGSGQGDGDTFVAKTALSRVKPDILAQMRKGGHLDKLKAAGFDRMTPEQQEEILRRGGAL